MTNLEADLSEGEPWMALEWSLILMEVVLDLDLAPCPVAGPIDGLEDRQPCRETY